MGTLVEGFLVSVLYGSNMAFKMGFWPGRGNTMKRLMGVLYNIMYVLFLKKYCKLYNNKIDNKPKPYREVFR